MTTKTLDCKNKRCPMPIVELALMVRKSESGDVILVEATDPAFLADLKAWSKMSGQPLDEVTDGDVKRAKLVVQ